MEGVQVLLLSREGEGRQTPLGELNCFNHGPHVDPGQKSQVRITVCSFVARGAIGAGSGLRAQSLLPSPPQASSLFALEIVLFQLTVKGADSPP